MTTWFTSDLHFGHKNIIKYCKRPWATAAEMDEALIENWNAVVKEGDDVWNLGDVAFCCSPAHRDECLSKLNGRHHLLLGNHDSETTILLAMAAGWYASVQSGIREIEVEEIEVEGQKIVLCHYALREWQGALAGAWHLFGHTHGGLRPFGKSVDVGVDNVLEVLRGVFWLPLKDEFEPGEALERRRSFYRPISFAEVKVFMDAREVGSHAQFGGK